MNDKKIVPINEPRHFEPQELFFSLTDPKGKIRYGNSVFTRISGYDEAGLIGQPHNIIRHPDMPRCVFRLFWDYLESGRTIAAFVKNMAADGRYYWVLAVATPCEGGHLSVRLKPSTPLFETAKKIYAETLAFERGIEAQSGKRVAIERSTAFFGERLAEAGFADYDEFMRAALAQEQVARLAFEQPAVGAGETALARLRYRSRSVAERLGVVFASLDAFQQLSDRLGDKHEVLADLGPSLSFLALNANISASRLGSEGATLSVIARNLGDRSKDADRLLQRIMNRMGPLCDNARELAFDVTVAQLEAQVSEAFSVELMEAEAATTNHRVQESLEVLNGELSLRCHKVLKGLHSLLSDVVTLSGAASSLVEQVEQMRGVQLNGKIEIASCRQAAAFLGIFEDVAEIIRSARGDCDEVIELLSNTGDRVRGLLSIEPQLVNDLAGVEAAVGATGQGAEFLSA